MKKMILALFLAVAVNSAVQATPEDFVNLSEIQVAPATKSFVANHKVLVRTLIAATVIGALTIGGVVAYKYNDKFNAFVKSTSTKFVELAKKAGNGIKTANTASFNYIKTHKTITVIILVTLAVIATVSIDKIVRHDASMFDSVVNAVYNLIAGKKEKTTVVPA